VPAGEQFRKASHSLASPSVEQQNWSDYSEGHPPVNDSDLIRHEATPQDKAYRS